MKLKKGVRGSQIGMGSSQPGQLASSATFMGLHWNMLKS